MYCLRELSLVSFSLLKIVKQSIIEIDVTPNIGDSIFFHC